MDNTADINNTTVQKKFSDIAVNKFLKEGYSCSESMVATAVELGIVPEDLINVATSFSGGMSNGCLCGAVAGSQMIIGYLHGKNRDNTARACAKEFYEKFTSIHKVTCCKVLTRGFSDFHSPERKSHCANMVETCSKILEEML